MSLVEGARTALSRWPRAARRVGVSLLTGALAAAVATGAASCTTATPPPDSAAVAKGVVGVAAAGGGEPGGTLRVLVAGTIDT